MSFINNVTPAEPYLRKSKQVTPLPIGPGGNNPIKHQMNQTNIQLTMLTAQANANAKYDPPVPQPITKPIIKEKFVNNVGFPTLLVIGGLLIVYGIVAK
jgi:hypothetical protein